MKIHEPIILTKELPQTIIPLTVNLQSTFRKRRSAKYLAMICSVCKQEDKCSLSDLPHTLITPELMLWLKPRGQVGIGERTGRVKVRKFRGWDKGSLISKTKATDTSKAKGEIHSPLLQGRQLLNPPSSQALCERMMLDGLDCPWGQLGSAVPTVSLLCPCNSLCTPSYSADGVRSRKGLNLVSALLSN